MTALIIIIIMLSLLALLLTNLLWFLFHRFASKPNIIALPPGPVPWPIVGSIPEMIGHTKSSSRSLWVLSHVEKTKQGIACIRLGNVHVIAVTSPEIAREFLKTHDAVFASRPNTMANHYASRGFLQVFSSPMGPQWKKMRRVLVSQVLNPPTLQWLLPKRVEEADNLVSRIYKQCCACVHEGKVINVRNVAWQYGGNVWKSMVFNKRSFNGDGSEEEEDQEYVEAIRTVLSLINAFCVSDYMPCLRWLDLDGHEKMMKQAVDIIDKYHDPLIDERIRELEINYQ
ncbi:hypothetical protein Scep_005864 [Stephania cephalantha]|uniref:Cytochrome P450 n=1 Tax=Stephania cephalantha TaxID=152367 RepID=A0AAP0KW55_9MAGN